MPGKRSKYREFYDLSGRITCMRKAAVRCSYDYLSSNERLPQASHAKITRLSQDKKIRRTCPALQPCVPQYSCDSLAIKRAVTLR